MHRTPVALATAALMLVPAAPIAAQQQGPAGTSSEVTGVSATAVDGGMQVTGSAAFGGQVPVVVATDPPEDANLTPRLGDQEGTEPGVDLLGAMLSIPDPAVPELLVEWQVADLPATGPLPEAVRYTLPFRVDDAVYVVQAKLSNLADPGTADDPQGHVEHVGAAFELQGDCTPSLQGTGVARCEHLAWLDGGFDTVRDVVSTRVPVGTETAPEILPGATLRPNDSENPDLNDILAGYGAAATPADDRAELRSAFTIPVEQVALGVATPGTDPRDVDYTVAADLEDGSFSATVPTGGADPESLDVFARACFAENCGYRSTRGASMTTGEVVGCSPPPPPREHPTTARPSGRAGRSATTSATPSR